MPDTPRRRGRPWTAEQLARLAAERLAFGRWMRAQRLALGWSLARMASALGLRSRKHLSEWERATFGARDPAAVCACR